MENIADLFRVRSTTNPMQVETVDIKVNMNCDGCERRVKHAVSSIKGEGVISVEVNREQSRVSVTGYVDPNVVLKRVQSIGVGIGNTAEFWPYIEHNLTYYPYAPEAYDDTAPPGYVRNVSQAYPTLNAPDEKYATLFSDENVHSCTIM